jgi:hypothetical protein
MVDGVSSRYGPCSTQGLDLSVEGKRERRVPFPAPMYGAHPASDTDALVCVGYPTYRLERGGESQAQTKPTWGVRNLGTGQTVAPGFVGSDRCVLSMLLQVMYSITTRTVIFP